MDKKRKYTVCEKYVISGGSTYARAESETGARRIASALNRAGGVCECEYIPRGTSRMYRDENGSWVANWLFFKYCPLCGKKVEVKK